MIKIIKDIKEVVISKKKTTLNKTEFLNSEK